RACYELINDVYENLTGRLGEVLENAIDDSIALGMNPRRGYEEALKAWKENPATSEIDVQWAVQRMHLIFTLRQGHNPTGEQYLASVLSQADLTPAQIEKRAEKDIAVLVQVWGKREVPPELRDQQSPLPDSALNYVLESWLTVADHYRETEPERASAILNG